MRYLFILFLLIGFTGLSVKATTINCQNSQYANKKLNFFQYSDPISLEPVFVFSLEFDKNGKCAKSIQNKTTVYTFCDFGIYQGMLFLEPNQTINLKLPPLREKSFADQKNPYFSPVSFWFTTENKEQLNNLVLDFTQQFNGLTDKFFNQLYFRQSQEIYDSVVFMLNKNFPDTKSPLLTMHKNLKIKMLEVDIFRQKPEDYSKLFSNVKPEFWLHPAFVSLFDKTFGGQLSFQAKKIKGEELRTAVNQSNTTFLLNFIKTKYNLTGEMVELSLLKMLHDGFYSGDFLKNPIKKMIMHERFTKHANQIIRLAALNISKKINHLQPDTEAPIICLNDIEGQKICTNSTRDKFKYIVFADTEMIVCREHLKYLANIHQRFQKYLEIYVVLRGTELSGIKKFLDDNKISEKILVDENNQFIEEYKIRSFPQCFLLDENLKVKFAQAKAPLDGFEEQFGLFLQHELFERQRKSSN